MYLLFIQYIQKDLCNIVLKVLGFLVKMAFKAFEIVKFYSRGNTFLTLSLMYWILQGMQTVFHSCTCSRWHRIQILNLGHYYLKGSIRIGSNSTKICGL